MEGLKPQTGVLRYSGSISDIESQISNIVIVEYGLKFKVNIATGHKTGFYLDQRHNRHRVGEFAKDRDVLNCFCYTGGFSIHALANGAKSVLSVVLSADALALLEENIALNLPADRHTSREGDVFQLLRKFRDENRSFDMIILYPPKFAPTAAHAEKYRVPIKISTCWLLNYCVTAECYSPTPAPAELTRRYFKRSSPPPHWMQARMRRSSNICHRAATTRSACIFPRARI